MITWLILAYDRTAEERFPFKRKWYRFNPDRATPEQVETVLRLVGHRERREIDHRPPLAVGETRVTWSLGGNPCTHRAILDYRHLFDFVPDGDDGGFGDMEGRTALLSVALPANAYFEDETEQPISLMEIFDEEAKRNGDDDSRAILLDHPESILRFDPSPPVRADLWTAKDAGLVMQLKTVQGQLMRSRWLRSKCVVSPVEPGQYEAVLPLQDDCMAVILPFRQLYSKDASDDLFNRVCNLHNRHCLKSHATRWWVAHYQKQFNSFLERPQSFPPGQTTLIARRYLDAFAYGARLVHATSRTADPAADLERLLKERSRELVVMGYHYILRQLLGYVSQALVVILHNVDHWIGKHDWATCPDIRNDQLFGG